MILRPYQIRLIESVRVAIRSGRRRVLLQLGTGAGKTVIASEIIRSANSRSNNCMFLAHRKELIDQASAKLDAFNVPHGIIRASDPRRKPWLRTHVCSVPTLIRRTNLPAADLLIVDEAHRSTADSYLKVIKQYPDAVVLGLSATPVRLDGKPLGHIYDALVSGPSVAELTEEGFLVPARIFAPSKPDLHGVHTQAGDYKTDELAKACDTQRLVGDIVQHWLRLAENRQTILFAVSIEHSRHIVEQFKTAGISCEHLDGSTPDDQRSEILKRLESGATRIVCNVGIMTEGFDCPPVSCIVLARPTQSVALYLQMVGRALRPYPGKTDCLILDHASAVFQHGFPDEEREWSLEEPDGGRKKRGERDAQAPSVRMCRNCWAAYKSTLDKCPQCGTPAEKQVREIQIEEGELEEAARRMVCNRCGREMPGARPGLMCENCGGTAKVAYRIGKLSKNPEVARLQKIAEERQYSPGWIFYQLQRLRQQGGQRAVNQ